MYIGKGSIVRFVEAASPVQGPHGAPAPIWHQSKTEPPVSRNPLTCGEQTGVPQPEKDLSSSPWRSGPHPSAQWLQKELCTSIRSVSSGPRVSRKQLSSLIFPF